MKQTSTLPSPLFDIRADVGRPLHRQLYAAIRQEILSGQLKAGARLPATRQLASELGISRSTIVTAYAQLLAEGYLEGQVGAGTSVAHTLPEELLHAPRTDAANKWLQAAHRQPSRRGQLIHRTLDRWVAGPEPVRPFQMGIPDFAHFPLRIWAQLISQVWNGPIAEVQQVMDGRCLAGYPPLREAVADYLRTARGVRCETEQVIIIAGVQQGLDLAARVLTDPGDVALVENPGYHGIKSALLAAGAKLVPMRLDGDGLMVDDCLTKKAKLLYVSPSHQYPLGVTLPLHRRLALLEWASREGVWLIEDDYDSEYRYVSRPLAALQGLDRAARVIYLGTFTKVMFPSLNMGYMVVPSDLVDTFVAARHLTDHHSSLPEQAAMARFISAGHFARHLRAMRKLYKERQAVLVEAAAHELGDLLVVRPAEAGIHIVGWLPNGANDVAVAHHLEGYGISVAPISGLSLTPLPRGGLVIGYAAFDEWQIRAAVKTMGIALKEIL